MIYVIDKADNRKESIRKVTSDFFKESLGFTDDDILFVDKSEFEWDRTNFSAEIEEAMKRFTRPIFEDTKHERAKQVLNIAICEEFNRYFTYESNFELTIELREEFTLENAREYFDSLARKIKTEGLTQIYFKKKNDFFLPDVEKGFIPN